MDFWLAWMHEGSDHPYEVAKQAATLALHSRNRLLMGIGAGWRTK